VFAGGFPAWMKAKGNYAAVSAEYVAAQIEKNTMVLVDSRPKRPKYDKGHIPTAMSIPDSQFEALKGKLPADKTTPLVFYCGGFT
jgi:rhodanese-related sulfurtransferase